MPAWLSWGRSTISMCGSLRESTRCFSSTSRYFPVCALRKLSSDGVAERTPHGGVDAQQAPHDGARRARVLGGHPTQPSRRDVERGRVLGVGEPTRHGAGEREHFAARRPAEHAVQHQPERPRVVTGVVNLPCARTLHGAVALRRHVARGPHAQVAAAEAAHAAAVHAVEALAEVDHDRERVVVAAPGGVTSGTRVTPRPQTMPHQDVVLRRQCY